MPEIISREQWGAKHPGGFYDRRLPITEWWLHHSVTIAPDLVPPFDDDDRAIRLLETIGQQRFGGGISYTYPVTPAGRVYEGHGIRRVGAHTKGHNTVGAAFCLVGNYDRVDPTDAQRHAIAEVMVDHHRRGWATRHTLNGGHRDVYPTSCPGARGYAAIADINRRARLMYATATPSPVKGAPAKVVKVVKQAVKRRPQLAVDGVRGPATIRAMQRWVGATPDGLWGPQTRRALQRKVGVPADGIVGPQTIRALQRTVGATTDGIWGPATTKALQRYLNKGGWAR
jgi:peptidoglycan hydrolase-like protein with peptidoglycan-binding domain